MALRTHSRTKSNKRSRLKAPPKPTVRAAIGKRKRPAISRKPSTDAADSSAEATSGKKPKQQPPPSTSSTRTSVEVPGHLKHVIHESKHGFFELTLPLGHLDGLQRLAWGLDSRTQSVFVCVKFGPDNSQHADHVLFCVHSRTDDEGTRLRAKHQFCSTKAKSVYAITKPCTSRSNIMTCLLSRELYDLLGRRSCRSLAVIYDSVSAITKSVDPTTNCLICEKSFDVKIYSPTACLGECLREFEEWPLRARLSHLLSDAKSLDFLLCSIYTAVRGQQAVPHAYTSAESLLVDCPLELGQVQPAIDSLPPISDRLSMKDLLEEGDTKTLSTHRRKLLSWLPQRFRGCMVSLQPDAEHLLRDIVQEGCHQFMFLNSRLERHAKFARNIEKLDVGSVGFHGCKAPRTFNILCDALRDPSKLPYYREDTGVFFSDDPNVSRAYATGDGHFDTWKGSQFATQGSGEAATWVVVFGIEVAKKDLQFNHSETSTQDESLLMIRYVLLVPCGGTTRRLALNHDAMKKAYRTLGKAELTARHVGLSEAQLA